MTERRGERPTNTCYNIHTYPSLFVEPRQVVGLRVVVTEQDVLAVDDLFDLGQRDPITLRTESHPSL